MEALQKNSRKRNGQRKAADSTAVDGPKATHVLSTLHSTLKVYRVLKSEVGKERIIQRVMWLA